VDNFHYSRCVSCAHPVLCSANCVRISIGLGQELEKIHEIKLSRTGFLGPEMKTGDEFSDFSEFICGYIKHVLSKLQERYKI